jgi:UDP-N-acetylmuramate dehydrogenase
VTVTGAGDAATPLGHFQRDRAQRDSARPGPARAGPARAGPVQGDRGRPGGAPAAPHGKQVRLASYTTLRLGGPAEAFVAARSERDVVDAVRRADAAGEPVLILGGGSNLVVADEGFPGTVVQVGTSGIEIRRDQRDRATRLVTAAAGEDWDTVVTCCVTGGLAGVECLAGIPGRVGATPIQNVGAYGQEVAETVTSVRALDRSTGAVVMLDNAACGFGYRTSMFKRAPGRFVVLEVTFKLDPERLSRPVRYAELASSLGVATGRRVPLGDVRDAVLDLRRGKAMVLDPADPDTRSAGSFFTNPVLGPDQFAALADVVRGRLGADAGFPRFAAPDGYVKVPAAWLIERAGFGKGYAAWGARISSRHTLALTNPGGATTAGLIALAREIRDSVRDTFGVTLVPEPVLVGVEL